MMDISVIKNLIRRQLPAHEDFCRRAMQADRYYRNNPDVFAQMEQKGSAKDTESPLRNADNRVPFNFHGLLVNQKAAYTFSAPPIFDIGSQRGNKALVRLLGDEYGKICKDLCVGAANASVAWLHVWRDELGDIQYAPVPSVEVIPIWSKSLKRRLIAVLRAYKDIDESTGKSYTVYEYWNDATCEAYRLERDGDLDSLAPCEMFLDVATGAPAAAYEHGVGEVPFFPFFNNNVDTGDLGDIKELIDAYCKVFSGFVNDLEDLQEVIFILTNYGGQNLGEFLTDLKKYKAIKIDNHGDGDSSGVSTLTIQLPVEARDKLLTITRKCIFEQGQGVDPDPQNFGNSSGVALKFLYALLELKAGLLETEFRLSFARFIRCLCRLAGIAIKDDTIIQTWTRTYVTNDLELAQIAAQSKGVVSDDTIVQHHPWVDNPEKELELLRAQEEEARQTVSDMFGDTNEAEAGNKEDDDKGEDKEAAVERKA